MYLVQIMACRLFGAKPLFEQLLTYWKSKVSIKVTWIKDGHALCRKLGVSNDGQCHPVANPKYHMLQQVFSPLCNYQPCFAIKKSCHTNYQHTSLCHDPRGCLKYVKDIWIEAMVQRKLYHGKLLNIKEDLICIICLRFIVLYCVDIMVVN